MGLWNSRIIIGMMWSMMKVNQMLNELWGEAMSMTVFILNHAPMKSLKRLTPFEVWHGRKPDVSFLRMFGCVDHIKVMKPHLSKLEDRSTPMVLQGWRLVARHTGCSAHAKAKWRSRTMLCSMRRQPGTGEV
jgi:hypothetical protein